MATLHSSNCFPQNTFIDIGQSVQFMGSIVFYVYCGVQRTHLHLILMVHLDWHLVRNSCHFIAHIVEYCVFFIATAAMLELYKHFCCFCLCCCCRCFGCCFCFCYKSQKELYHKLVKILLVSGFVRIFQIFAQN